MIFELVKPLHFPKNYLCDLDALKIVPLSLVELCKEFESIDRTCEIYESIAHVTFGSRVDRKIEEIILELTKRVDLCGHHFQSVFVGDISHHDRLSFLFPCQNVKRLDSKFFI